MSVPPLLLFAYTSCFRFLLASLQVAALRECTSVHDVEEVLLNAPGSIEDLYVQTWDRILSQTPTKVSLVKRLLVWVLNATRSLTLEELQYAVATNPDTYLFEKARLVPEQALVGMCRGLVMVEDETNLVRLVRESLFSSCGILVYAYTSRLHCQRHIDAAHRRLVPLSSHSSCGCLHGPPDGMWISPFNDQLRRRA